MEETKNNQQDIDITIKEERRQQVDNRRQVMHDLGLKEDHPHFIEIKPQLEKLPFDWQVLFYPIVKEQCDIYDEEYREFTKANRLKLKLHELRNNRKRVQK